MNVKIDIDIACWNCGEKDDIDYQLTRKTVGWSETERVHSGKLLVHVVCRKCKELSKNIVENNIQS